MKLYTIVRKDAPGQELVAEGTEGGYRVLQGVQDMNALIASGVSPESLEKGEFIREDECQVLAPIPRPLLDVVCLGLNYTAHVSEAERFSKEAFGGERPWPIFFAKRVNEAPGPGAPIPAHEDIVDSLDYECELGVVIGKDACGVKKEDAGSYIFGYTIVNDVSARNLQTRHKQWYFGKSLDGFTPMGPCIVTADEIAFPPKLPISCSVNGEMRQDSTTENLITGIGEIIEMLSAGMTLKAGTVIATGTPAGVGMGMQPPCFLKPQDVVRCEIGGIGVLENTVVSSLPANR